MQTNSFFEKLISIVDSMKTTDERQANHYFNSKGQLVKEDSKDAKWLYKNGSIYNLKEKASAKREVYNANSKLLF